MQSMKKHIQHFDNTDDLVEHQKLCFPTMHLNLYII